MAADLGGARGGGGSTAKNAYLQCLRSSLNAAICLTNFGCQEIERNNKPEVEMGELFCHILQHRVIFCASGACCFSIDSLYPLTQVVHAKY